MVSGRRPRGRPDERCELWSCPAAINSPVGNVVQTMQVTSTDTNAPVVRYWLWRFDRPDDPVGTEDFWGKTEPQAVTDLQSTNDPTVGPINGPIDVVRAGYGRIRC